MKPNQPSTRGVTTFENWTKRQMAKGIICIQMFKYTQTNNNFAACSNFLIKMTQSLYILSKLNLIVFDLLKYMQHLSLLNSFVLDYMNDLFVLH